MGKATQGFNPADAIRLPPSGGRRPLRKRAVAAAGVVGAGALATLPHVLHHAGPFAGAALLGGASGSVLFGLVGFLATVPMLLRLRRRSGSWRLPAALLGLFATVFVVTTLVVQPALGGGDDAPVGEDARGGPDHTQHHR
jgi:hypothetical protein